MVPDFQISQDQQLLKCKSIQKHDSCSFMKRTVCKVSRKIFKNNCKGVLLQ